MFYSMPRTIVLISDNGYDSDYFRESLKECGVTTCIQPRRKQIIIAAYNNGLYKTRHKIENCFAKQKNWMRTATKNDGYSHTFFSAICVDASYVFYVNQ